MLQTMENLLSLTDQRWLSVTLTLADKTRLEGEIWVQLRVHFSHPLL